MSTSYNVEYNPQIQNQQKIFVTPVNELKRRAFVDRSKIECFSIRNWLGTAAQCYNHGDVAIHNNDLENAYVAYMKGSTIMVEIVRFHSGHLSIRSEPAYTSLKMKTEDVIKLLKELAHRIDTWYSYQHQLKQIPTHYTPYTQSTNPYTEMSRQSIVASQQRFLNKSSNTNLSDDFSNKLKVSSSSSSSLSSVDLPSSWAHHNFPQGIMIQSHDLASHIQSQKNAPQVLLVDLRSRKKFNSGCIQHKWIIQIDPSIFQKNVTKLQIEESLSNNPDIEQTLFKKKNEFDLIVYYDQNSKAPDVPHMNNFKRVVETYQLKRPPIMLTGGFDAWQFVVGERGIYRFPTAAMENKGLNKSNSSLSSTSEENSVHDYFIGESGAQKIYLPISKPKPLATRRESGTNRYPNMLSSETFKSQVEPSQYNIRPTPPAQAILQRRRTFIDNPFNGFTTTASKLYDVPPIPTGMVESDKKVQHKSHPVYSMEPSVNRPFTLGDYHHMSTSGIQLTPSSVLSHQGGIVAIGTTGLKNLGNTCYMNSIIQCLSGTLPFARYFISGAFRQHVNRTNKLGTGGVLTERFADLLRAMWNENYNFVSPMTFREAIIKFAPRFSGRDQHDSQEFLTFLLDGIHEDVNLAHTPLQEIEYDNLPDWQASAMSWERYLTRHTSIVVSIFQGQYQSRLICSSCKHNSTTYTPFMSLSLPIPAKRLKISNVTLYQCLDFFVKEEVLEKEDAWFCPQCKKKRKATKQLTLSRLPDVLLIHLKRFSADGLFKNKLDATVKYPTRGLDLHGYVSKFIPPKQASAQDRASSTYDLYAISNHYGSLSGGHYTAYVKDGHREVWHYFDDSKFSTCDESKVITKAAYNLFYVRSKVK